MNYKATKKYLLSKPEAIENYPFGPDVAVIKVKDKMFATLTEQDNQASMNLKCEPLEVLDLQKY